MRAGILFSILFSGIFVSVSSTRALRRHKMFSYLGMKVDTEPCTAEETTAAEGWQTEAIALITGASTDAAEYAKTVDCTGKIEWVKFTTVGITGAKGAYDYSTDKVQMNYAGFTQGMPADVISKNVALTIVHECWHRRQAKVGYGDNLFGAGVLGENTVRIKLYVMELEAWARQGMFCKQMGYSEKASTALGEAGIADFSTEANLVKGCKAMKEIVCGMYGHLSDPCTKSDGNKHYKGIMDENTDPAKRKAKLDTVMDNGG